MLLPSRSELRAELKPTRSQIHCWISLGLRKCLRRRAERLNLLNVFQTYVYELKTS